MTNEDHRQTLPERPRLGAFRVLDRFARGGMGDVWHAEHIDTQLPVAIKVAHGGDGFDETAADQFRHEVQAVVRLAHPHIVVVFDYGFVSDEAFEASGGRLRRGSPYLVMEYASRGALEQLRPPLTWSDFRNINSGILKGLAHAHSRGVIHRDLKPGNVLLGSTEDARPDIKLADFGIAYALDRNAPSLADASPAGRIEDVMGTPLYMAPEQLRGLWRRYGPWTDLYALGVLAWELATGEPPFLADNHYDLALLHLTEPPPEFVPTFDAPAALEPWLRALLAKDPLERFALAADALAELRRMDDERLKRFGVVSEFQPAPTAPPQPQAMTMPLGHPSTAPHRMRISEMPTREWKRPFLHGHGRIGPTAFELRYDPEHARKLLPGAGLNLFTWRTPPLVGRELHLDKLYAALDDVRVSQRARIITIGGPRGSGRSRLAEAFCHNANEQGAAHWLHARCNPLAGQPPIARMFIEHLRCVGLRDRDLGNELRERLDEVGLDPVATARVSGYVMARRDREDAPATDEERAALALALSRMSDDRPLIIWLDDIDMSDDAMSLALELLDRNLPGTRVLVVATLHEDPPVADNEGIARLIAHERSGHIHTEWLNERHMDDLLQRVLPLSPHVRDALVGASQGNPGHALGVLAEWIDRGELEHDSDGFALVRKE